ncbi:MAG: homoserine O-acetyltransferase MetX [Acidimicrobiia bacterium]
MKHVVTVPGVFSLERGGTLRDVTVEVRTWGKHRPNATLICHALTGNADADEWWSDLFRSGSVFDPAKNYVVATNVLGGCSGTTGPTTVGPNRTASLGPDFPRVTIRDMVRLQKAVLDQLGVTSLDLVTGGSMGGMQALEWAAMYPEVVTAVAPIAVGSAQSAWAIGLSETQRHAITTDANWKDGQYTADAPPSDGLSTARMIAMCSYRSSRSFQGRFARGRNEEGFDVQTYLRYQGTKLTERFDANTYLTLLDAMDSHDLGRGRGPLEAILRKITTRALVVGISSDVLYPVHEVRALAEALPNARFTILDSDDGHDAFLIDTETLDATLQAFLTESTGPVAQVDTGAGWA